MTPTRLTLLTLSLAFPALLCAQEVRYIDLTVTPQRTELRHPPPPDCDHGQCHGEGGGSIGDGAPDIHDPHALGVYLLRVTPAEINAAESFEAEFKVFNSGIVPIALPVSPHLSDLQPGNDSIEFNYLSLALVVHNAPAHMPVLAFAQLYGSMEYPDTILLLQPGEWIRVKANLKLEAQPPQPFTALLRGDFWLRRNIYRPKAGGQFTETQNLYPNSTPTPPIEVHILAPAQSDEPKQSTNAPTK
jgi:hypothetical protein